MSELDNTGISVSAKIVSDAGEDRGGHRATADVSIGGGFMVKGVRIFEGKNGLFVSMPSIKLRNGERMEVCYPTTKEFHEKMCGAVLDSYRLHVAQRAQNNDKESNSR